MIENAERSGCAELINRLTNHTLLALNLKTQFGLPDPNDNVLEE